MPTKTHVMRLERRYSKLQILNSGAEFKGTSGFSSSHTQTVTYSENIPGWKQLIAEGKNATTSLTGRKFKVKSDGYFRFYFNKGKVSYAVKEAFASGYIPKDGQQTFTGYPGVDQTKANNDALTNFVKRAKGVSRLFQGGIFLGELTEAVRMVKNPANALRRGLDDYAATLKKRRPQLNRTPPNRRLAVARRIVSDTWLEASFGWTPLLSDIENGVKAIQSYAKDENRPRLVKVSGKGSSSTTMAPATSGDADGPIVLNYLENRTNLFEVKFYGAVSAFNPRSQAFNHWGVSLSDVAPTVWELVPWSFLADYFANIGNIIECATFLRSSLAWVNRSTKASVTQTFSVSTPPFPGGTRYVLGVPAEFELAEVTRAAYTGSLIPTLEFRLPGSGWKVANMAALASSLKRITPYHR